MSRPPGAALVPTANARLPETYESAKQALAECSEIDETPISWSTQGNTSEICTMTETMALDRTEVPLHEGGLS